LPPPTMHCRKPPLLRDSPMHLEDERRQQATSCFATGHRQKGRRPSRIASRLLIPRSRSWSSVMSQRSRR